MHLFLSVRPVVKRYDNKSMHWAAKYLFISIAPSLWNIYFYSRKIKLRHEYEKDQSLHNASIDRLSAKERIVQKRQCVFYEQKQNSAHFESDVTLNKQ